MTGNDPDHDPSRDPDGDELTHARGENAFIAMDTRTSPDGEPEELTEARGETAFARGYPGLPAKLMTPDQPSGPPPTPPYPAPPLPAPPRPTVPEESRARGEDGWNAAGFRPRPSAVAVPGHRS